MPTKSPQSPRGANSVSSHSTSAPSPYIPSVIPDAFYQAIVQPDQVFTVSRYFLDHWLPCLNPAHAWLILALRQRSFVNQGQNGCEVSYQQLAADTGLHPATVKNFFQAPYTAWFVPHIQPQYRFSPALGQTVRAPNRYWLFPGEPAAPHHLAGLLALLQQIEPSQFDATLQNLIKQPPVELRRQLTETASDVELPLLTEGTVRGLIKHLQAGSLKDPAHRYSQTLQRRLVAGRLLLGTQYFRLKWVPLLGPTLAWLVVLLRSRCYHNSKTGQVRHTYTWNKQELARALGQTPRHIFDRLLAHPFAPAFVELLDSTPHQATFRVRMWQEQEPLTPADAQHLGSDGVQLTLWSDIFDSTLLNFLSLGSAKSDIFDSHAGPLFGQNSPAFKHSLNTINLKAPGSTDLSKQGADDGALNPSLPSSNPGDTTPARTSFIAEPDGRDEIPLPNLIPAPNTPGMAVTDEARWQQTLHHLRPQMTRAAFDLWLSRSRLVSRREGVLVIEVESEYAREWLQNRLLTMIRRAVAFIWQHSFDIEFRVSKPA